MPRPRKCRKVCCLPNNDGFVPVRGGEELTQRFSRFMQLPAKNWPMRWLRDFLCESREEILHSATETAQPTGAEIAINKKSIRCTKNRKEIIL